MQDNKEPATEGQPTATAVDTSSSTPPGIIVGGPSTDGFNQPVKQSLFERLGIPRWVLITIVTSIIIIVILIVGAIIAMSGMYKSTPDESSNDTSVKEQQKSANVTDGAVPELSVGVPADWEERTTALGVIVHLPKESKETDSSGAMSGVIFDPSRAEATATYFINYKSSMGMPYVGKIKLKTHQNREGFEAYLKTLPNYYKAKQEQAYADINKRYKSSDPVYPVTATSEEVALSLGGKDCIKQEIKVLDPNPFPDHVAQATYSTAIYCWAGSEIVYVASEDSDSIDDTYQRSYLLPIASSIR